MSLKGQVLSTVTAEELNLQKLFIDANRAKLLGRLDNAEELYLQILEQDPRNHAAAYELSRVLESMERYDEAIDQIKRAVRLDPQNTWYRLMQADILERTEDYAGAIEIYDQLSKLKPNENYFYDHLVELYLKTNQQAQALQALDNYEAVAGVIPAIILRKVDIMEAGEDYGNALAEIKKLIEVYPGEKGYLFRAAELSKAAGIDEQASTYLKAVLEIDPQDARANLALASKYRSAGNDSDYLRSVVSLMNNPDIDIDIKIAELLPYLQRYVHDGNTDLGAALEKTLSGLAELHSDEAKAHAIYADYLYHAGQLERAADEYEKTLVLDQRVFDVWEKLVLIKAETGDMDGLIKTTGNAINFFPNQPLLYYMSGVGYAYREDFEMSIAELQQALIMSSRNEQLQIKILGLLGSVYDEIGDATKSLDAYNKAVQLSTDDHQLLIRYAEALARSGFSLSRAQKMAENALANDPDNMHAEHVLALIAYKRGDFDEATRFMEDAMTHGAGDNFASLELYGDISYSRGEVDKAVEYWQLSLHTGNNSPVLRRKISDRKLLH